MTGGLGYDVTWGQASVSYCQGFMTEVIIPDAISAVPVTKISSGVFATMNDLETVQIPASITTIGEGAFPKAHELLQVVCGSTAQTWAQEQGYTLDGNGESTYRYQVYQHQETVEVPEIPATCTEPGLTAATVCSACGIPLQEQTEIPALGHDWQAAEYTWRDNSQKVEALCVCAHDAAHTITETANSVLTLQAPDEEPPGSATYTAQFTEDVFSAQTKTVDIPALGELRVLRLPMDLRNIEEEAFAGLNVHAVILPDGCESIGKRAFADCPSLLYVRIPASVTSIAADAFEESGQAVIDRAQ